MTELRLCSAHACVQLREIEGGIHFILNAIHLLDFSYFSGWGGDEVGRCNSTFNWLRQLKEKENLNPCRIF